MTEPGGTSPAAPPLSVAQEALWYLSLLVPNQVSYNEMVSIRKDGPFDVAAFRRSFDEIVRRHEAWRTTFDMIDGVPSQILHPAQSFELPVHDLSHLSFDEAEHRAVEVAAEASKVPYDLRRGPLLRPRLIRFSGEYHRLYLAMHHLVFDGVSVYRVVLPELVALYDAFCAGEPSPLPEPRTRYADYARWEQHWITEPRVARRMEHWRQHLTGLPTLNLPLDHQRPATQRFRGGVVALSVPRETVHRLREIGQGAGATLFQVLATAWSLLLGRWSGQDDVVFATATDLRQRPEFESVVGYSLTPLVLRIDLSGDPGFSDLVVRVRNELLDGLDNLIPFERLVRELNPDRIANANPVYQAMFILEPQTLGPDPSWSMHQMESEIGEAVGSAKLDFELELDERPDGHIAGRLIYDRDLFEAASATRMAEHWQRLVVAVAADPTLTVSSIDLAAPEDRRQLVEWNATTTVSPPATIHALVDRQATRQPSAPAVAADGAVVTYAELDHRAGRVARRLVSAGVGPGDVVALGSGPTVELVAGMLGVLKAGASYLLLDPGLSPERLDVLADSAAAILASPAFATRLTTPPPPVLALDPPHGGEEVAASATVDPGAVCCVQDGTRGASGVLIRHGSVVNLATAMATELGIGAADTVLVLPSTLFRVPALELWMPLIAGAKIVVAPAEIATDGARLSRLITAERVSFLHASAATWGGLIDSGLKASRSLMALSGGEGLTRELADRILDRCRVLWHAYGAVETTFYSTLARVRRSEPVSIGRPIANTRAYVLDADGRPVPVGVAGELVIAGAGVVSGYRGEPERTAEAFIDDPFGPGAAYPTGDVARWLTSGELELVSR